ncbi:MAG: dATP pyrophosphohydrolase [Hyphomicrobiaceae bacterium]
MTVCRVGDGGTQADWLHVPHAVFAGDPNWVPPLHTVEKRRISPRHNPLFAAGQAAFFVAYRDGAPVGRISAQVDHRHLRQHRDETGHFGFFDCIDDVDVAHALTDRASNWLRERGLSRMVGPFNLSINEDIGLLVDGFSAPPAILTSHAPRWAHGLLDRCGFAKKVDLLGYRMRPAQQPPELRRLAALAQRSGRVRVRMVDVASYRQELELLFDIFNDAWSDNWGFVPVGPAEIDAIAQDTRPIIRSKFGRIAEIDGVPAAMMVALPDINRVITPFGGRLLPFNWIRLAHAILADRWKTARIPLLGIRKAYRRTPIAAGVLSLLVSEFVELARAYDLDWIEFSWVLETNTQMVKLAELAAGPAVKRYRIYEKSLCLPAS